MTGIVTAEPSWVETTLTWLKQNRPEYLGGRGGPSDKLQSALVKSSWLSIEHGHDIKEINIALRARIAGWSLSDFMEYTTYLKGGGFEAAADSAELAKKGRSVAKDVLVASAQEIPKSPAQQAEDDQAAAQLASDPRLGAW